MNGLCGPCLFRFLDQGDLFDKSITESREHVDQQVDLSQGNAPRLFRPRKNSNWITRLQSANVSR